VNTRKFIIYAGFLAIIMATPSITIWFLQPERQFSHSADLPETKHTHTALNTELKNSERQFDTAQNTPENKR